MALPAQNKIDMRMSVDEWFLMLADAVASRSSCKDGRKHGAVLALEGRYIVSAGYNGTAKGQPHCAQVCMWPGYCPSVHAEVNLMLNAGKVNVDMEKCVVYCTKQPCDHCMAVMLNAGVPKVVWREPQKKNGMGARHLFPKERS